MNTLSVRTAEKLKARMPLTREEKLEYIRFKSRLMAEQVRRDFKKLTGKELE